MQSQRFQLLWSLIAKFELPLENNEPYWRHGQPQSLAYPGSGPGQRCRGSQQQPHSIAYPDLTSSTGRKANLGQAEQLTSGGKGAPLPLDARPRERRRAPHSGVQGRRSSGVGGGSNLR